MMDSEHNTQPQDQHGGPLQPGRGRVLAIGGAGTVALCAATVAALSVFGASSAANTTPQSPEPVTVTVTSPTNGSVIGSDQVTVRGTVTPADATVTIQSRPAAVGDGVFTGSTTLHSGKTSIDVIASAPGAAPASATVTVSRPSAPHPQRSTAGASATPPLPTQPSQTGCGAGISVGPNTSCQFAENVRAAYDQAGPGVVTAYSPVTGSTYEMDCSYGTYVTCTGANDASVYFPSRSAPSYTPAPQHAPVYGTRSCDTGLSVGPHTTCPFAENVRAAFESNGPGALDVYSPVTRQTYPMSCSGGSPAVCTGGNEAAVYVY